MEEYKRQKIMEKCKQEMCIGKKITDLHERAFNLEKSGSIPQEMFFHKSRLQFYLMFLEIGKIFNDCSLTCHLRHWCTNS